ncbi:uncharacterized protein LOC134535345 [Bacillus rossius redtenbacheri]|uniref:uncharacterized protein LOC134535345 n=1 Tax=Bacillus rossius redtenbacheri TaxID=93214 RepID=UPI002FDE07CF
MCPPPSLETVVERFWEIEDFPTCAHLSPEDEACEAFFKTTHHREPSGRYVVFLPFHSPKPILGDSRAHAVRCLEALERRLVKQPGLRTEYQAFMEDYLRSGHMEVMANPLHDFESAYYLPHHGVIKAESTTTKLRVVFNASAKTQRDVSLNDLLMTGPKLQTDVREILLRVRVHKVVFTADIKQMYRQIMVDKEHQEYQRIVWRCSPTDPIVDYRLQTVTYGVSSAPYLAIRTLHQLAQDEQCIFPQAAHVLKSDFYVDDVVTGANSVEEAIALQKELIALFAAGGFHLRKFASTHSEVLEWLSPDQLQSPASMSFDKEQPAVVKVLGVQWNPSSDYSLPSASCSMLLLTAFGLETTVVNLRKGVLWDR